jgi:predicted AlkP superfamily phosphohydrolase/phosphomutase
MPHLARVFGSALTAPLESVVPPVTASAWTSFMTGKHPGKHGILGFSRFDFKEYREKLNNAEDIQSKTIWQVLSEKGKRIVVLHLPFTYPPYEVNGVIVSGWDVPSVSANFTYPEELRTEVLRLAPDYESSLDLALWQFASTRSENQFSEFTSKLVRAFEQTAQLALHFLERERDWDVFMVHFQQTDFIQHKLWNLIEAACKDAKDGDRRLEKVRQCYRRFDEMVGWLLAAVEKIEPFEIILSDHGFGDYKGAVCPNYYLRQWGYLHLAPGQKERLGAIKDVFRRSRFSQVRRFYRALYEAKTWLLETRAARQYKSWHQYATATLPGSESPIDWSKTKAVTLMATQVAFIYVNLVGRGPLGTVHPGHEYDHVVADLMTRIRELRHPQTAAQLIREVVRGADLYPNPSEGVPIPDLVLIPVDGYGFSTAVSNQPPEPSTQGLHRFEGVFSIRGEGLKRAVSGFEPRLIDVAPTVLHLLDLPVPTDMDGRVLEEIFETPRSVRHETPGRIVPRTQKGYSAAEAEAIEQRLKSLGYVE